MKNNHQRTHRLIAYVLLFSLFLQSCRNFSNQPVPRAAQTKEKEKMHSITQGKRTTSLVDQEFTAEKGYLVTFHEQDGRLQADVKIDATQQEPNYTNIPVILAKDAGLSELSYLDTTIQQRRIRVERSSTERPSRIVVARGGLKGGMMEGEGEKEKEKEKEEATPLEKLESAYKRLRLNKSLSIIPQGEITLHYNKRLGAGGGGSVYQAAYQDDIVAAKVLHASNEETFAIFQKEAIIMANHRHNNIVSFLGFCPGYNALVMEYVAGGSLWSLLKDKTKDIPWLYHHEIALDIAEGLNYLHDCGIVHGDLKSENILLGDNGQAKITDFGTGALKNENSSFGTLITGTLRWMAPDIILSDRNSKAGDVYSYGMILWQLGARELPFAKLNGFALIEHIKAGNPEKITEDTPPQIRKVIASCWLPTLQRPTMRQVRHLLEVGHPDFIDNEKEELIESLSKQKEELFTQLKKLGKEKEELISELGNLSKQKEELASRLEEINKEKEELRSELERSGKEKEVLTSRLEKLDKEKEELMKRLKQADSTLEDIISAWPQGKEILGELKGTKEGEALNLTNYYRLLNTDQSRILFQHPRFKQVKLELTVGAAGAQELAKALPQSQIHTLYLNANEIGDSGAQELAKALPQSQIHTLHLIYNSIGDSGAQELAKALPQSQIHTLYLSLNHIGDLGAQELAKTLPQSQIHTLDLSENNIGAAGTQELAKFLPHSQIHRLYLKKSNNIGDSGVQELAKALPTSQIHTLDLSYNDIGDLGAQELAKALPTSQIHTLDLSYNDIGDLGAQELAKALTQSQIHTLDLTRNNIGSEGVSQLAEALPKTQIHTLDLTRNNIGDSGAQELAKALPYSKIHRLYLSYDNIGEETRSLLKKKFPHINFGF